MKDKSYEMIRDAYNNLNFYDTAENEFPTNFDELSSNQLSFVLHLCQEIQYSCGLDEEEFNNVA